MRKKNNFLERSGDNYSFSITTRIEQSPGEGPGTGTQAVYPMVTLVYSVILSYHLLEKPVLLFCGMYSMPMPLVVVLKL